MDLGPHFENQLISSSQNSSELNRSNSAIRSTYWVCKGSTGGLEGEIDLKSGIHLEIVLVLTLNPPLSLWRKVNGVM